MNIFQILEHFSQKVSIFRKLGFVFENSRTISESREHCTNPLRFFISNIMLFYFCTFFEIIKHFKQIHEHFYKFRTFSKILNLFQNSRNFQICEFFKSENKFFHLKS